VCSIKFANGSAHFRSKYVKTTGYVMEKNAHKLIFKGPPLYPRSDRYHLAATNHPTPFSSSSHLEHHIIYTGRVDMQA
jgi:carotenoid cleavage dioxygenase-like enzyme